MYKNTKEIPAELKSHLKEETFEKSRLYECDKSKLGFMSGTYSQIEATVSQRYYFCSLIRPFSNQNGLVVIKFSVKLAVGNSVDLNKNLFCQTFLDFDLTGKQSSVLETTIYPAFPMP